ncbi:biorientation of chromosomes in cell division protein 1-like 1 [Alligator mississippiensis]|uniref:Biorientation of chromosomes in cell division protein 1-like 1 n=1 Tax=Alligator mississippiensis TaxID=8496 RepID=A0A151P9V0_ALLMI|nr:biorientation of chromosomes in cell division protein 1-like 1 [Alligator mississippiensis]
MGLFDQFRRDCLADVDTKPAYQNLRQRVDNFVSNHLATHTWSPHLNKNQLRNNIRQQVLKSGMLESGIDRIISQVVDPKINHTFRPQVEKAVHEFLATLNHKEEAGPSTSPSEEKADTSIVVQGVSTAAPSASVASDAMSILETITSLNQEASAARASTDNTNSKNNDRPSKRLLSQQSIDGSTERERNSEDLPDRERAICDPEGEGIETVAKCEDLIELPCQSEEVKNVIKDANNLVHASKEILQESEDQKSKLTEKGDKKQDGTERGERKKDKKEKADKKSDYTKKNDDNLKSKEEKHVKEVESVKQLVPEKNSNKHRAAESTKEEYAMEDSDMEVLSDITVSSVHTSDLSSFEEESEEEVVVSDTTEEGEITSDDEEEKNNRSKTKTQTNEPSDGKTKPVRHAYIHKPFLYSKYYSDSDDERTVEQRRQSIAREKEERLLRRQINRERLEEKRKQKAAEKTKSLKTGSQDAKGKSGLNSEESSVRGIEIKATGTSIKDVLKEQKFLEKKVALSRKRKRDSRYVENSLKKQCEDDPKETQKTNEVCEKISKEMKHNHDLQESFTKQDSSQKPDKDKNIDENDAEKQRKSKNEDKVFEESNRPTLNRDTFILDNAATEYTGKGGGTVLSFLMKEVPANVTRDPEDEFKDSITASGTEEGDGLIDDDEGTSTEKTIEHTIMATSTGEKQAEEDGGGVTEGFAESESVLTSTKEEESGECTMTDAEESGKGSVNASGVEIEDHVNSAGTEEKDDAVTSAGSEEKRKASTCVGAEERGHNFIICSVTDADAQEESTVTGACVEMVTNNNTKIGTRPNKCEDTVNGESAVTSTGITAEDDADIAVVCTGLGDSSEGFAVCLRAEKCESAMGSTGAKEDNITMISIGSCDDEGFVTSTGSKEDDEEGMEDESALICISAEEGESSIICIVAEHVEAESGVAATNVNKVGVDSLTGAEKEANGGLTCKNVKGIVESSVTSAGTVDEDVMTPNTEKGNSDFEGPMTTLVAKEDENPVLIYTDKEEKSKDDIHSTSTVEEDTEETEAPMPSTAIDFKGSLHTASCRQEKDECTMISTSIVEEFEAPMPSAARECTAARTEEMNESNVVSIDMELYEVPMPSASSAEDDYTSHPTGSGKEEKDECAMISTSIVEEQVILISSEVTEDRVEHVASGGEAKNETVMIPTSSAECFKSHVSSAVAQDEDQFTASGAEERYETAMITTSMTEECEIVLISTARQPKNPLIVTRAEQKHETTIISPNAPEESKIVETSTTTDEQFELATLDPGEKSEGSVIFVGNVEECGAPMIAVASNNEDSNTASCAENTEENAVITLSAVEECDSLFTFAVIEESQLDAASTEIKDKNDVTFKSTAQIDYILSSTDSDKSDGSLPLASEGEDESVHSEKKENHDTPVMGESTTSKSTVVTEVLGTAENTVKLLSIGKTLCVEITETTACVSPSAEVSTDSERTEDDLPYVDVTSELSCMSSEAAVGNVDYKVNTNLLSESDFSEIRTPPYREQTLSLLSEFGSTLTVNTSHDELSLAAKLGRKNDLPLYVDEQFVSGDKRNAVKVNDDLGFEVSLKKNTTFNSGNKTPVSNSSEELKFKTEVKTEEAKEFKGPTREDPYEEPLAKGCQKDLLQDNAALEKDSKDVENSGMQTAEYSYKEKISKLLETTDKESVQESSNSMVMMEMIKIQTKKKSQVVEMPDQEKGIRMSAMRKKQEGETDDCSVTQDWEKDEQSQCSKTKSKSVEETNSGDTAEVSKVISKKRSSLSSSGEEIDEFTSKQEIYEKADQISESNINSVEQNQPAIVKRKRGRPRKYPLEAVQPDANLKVDKSIGNSPTSALEENTPQTAKDLSIQKETANEEEAGKIEVMVRRRGRKPKRSLIPAEETETLEPERKRRKSASTTEEETKDQEEDEDEDGDEDDEAHSGATTRSATRLEAQRKQPSKPTTRATFKGNSPSPVSPSKHQKLAAKKRSPSDIKVSKSPPSTQLKMQSTKRKREASPTVVRRKGQQKPDETPLKKTKR